MCVMDPPGQGQHGQVPTLGTPSRTPFCFAQQQVLMLTSRKPGKSWCSDAGTGPRPVSCSWCWPPPMHPGLTARP